MEPVSVQAVANYFFNLARKKEKFLTNMQLQKLVYIAHGYTLALLNQELYYNNTHAWKFGPVIPKLYKPLQKYGNGEVLSPIPAEDELNDPEKESVVQAVWEAYGHFSGGELSAATHKPGTPWEKTWKKKPYGIIPIDVIKPYYEELAAYSQ